MSVGRYSIILIFLFGLMIMSGKVYAADPIVTSATEEALHSPSPQIYLQFVRMGTLASYYDECANQGLIKNSGEKAIDQLGKWIDESPVPTQQFLKDVTPDQMRDTARQAVDKSIENFDARKPKLSQKICNRAEKGWTGLMQSRASKPDAK